MASLVSGMMMLIFIIPVPKGWAAKQGREAWSAMGVSTMILTPQAGKLFRWTPRSLKGFPGDLVTKDPWLQ
ncbi:hypothetical protein DM02DRAFT_618666 [Periconia macrospinosa]|uniref:Uncharacterized protein n=1 Tax=Periconia macrospinosa TaxID=97972 RepID=A0A2V1DA30_9PLEO|nr:hypothetical protein DM02DRAFT_618666 [Periconia macrospinosa]